MASAVNFASVGLGELVVDPLQVPAAVRGEERAAVDLFLPSAEERAEDTGGLAVQGSTQNVSTSGSPTSSRASGP